ncbi:hypothetical protein V8E36_003298 [Tilletia maclaganii]
MVSQKTGGWTDASPLIATVGIGVAAFAATNLPGAVARTHLTEVFSRRGLGPHLNGLHSAVETVARQQHATTTDLSEPSHFVCTWPANIPSHELFARILERPLPLPPTFNQDRTFSLKATVTFSIDSWWTDSTARALCRRTSRPICARVPCFHDFQSCNYDAWSVVALPRTPASAETPALAGPAATPSPTQTALAASSSKAAKARSAHHRQRLQHR